MTRQVIPHLPDPKASRPAASETSAKERQAPVELRTRDKNRNPIGSIGVSAKSVTT